MDSDSCFIGYRQKEDEDLSLPLMRQMCDAYLRTVVPGMFCGSNTFLDSHYFRAHRDLAESSLNAFNNAKGRNFKLVKLLKCNCVVSHYICWTFQAKEDGSDECLLFRAIVNMVGTDNALLCEIRDGDENKDLGDDFLSLVRPAGQYICLKHEFGECHSADGSRGGKCDYAAGFTYGKCGLKHEFGECHSADGSRGGKCDYAAGFTHGKCGEFKKSLLTYLSHHGIPENTISDFKILERYLSPIRLQGHTETCLFIVMASCLEMMLRILGIQVPSWDKIYFLDVPDSMDRLCQIYPVADGTGPISMEMMLAFATKYGFKVTSLCKEPREVDHLANFDDEALRCRIHGYSTVKESEVLKYVEKFPIIACVYPHESMRRCTWAFYGGPTEDEKMIKDSLDVKHCVLVVGSVKVNTETYLIVQNSWSKTSGFSGFMMFLFDCTDIFTVFVLPHIEPEKFPYEKMENGTPRFMERHSRKRRWLFDDGETSRPSRGDDIMDLDPSR